MTQFATNADLASRLGLTLTAGEQTRADALLTLASGLIQQKTRQTISLVNDDVLTRPGDYSERIRLPQRPVVSVASVVLYGITLVQGDQFYVDGDEIARMNWNSVVQDSSFGRPWSGWGFPWWNVVVTYTHGFATIPELVKAICMEMAVRVWVNPGSVAREHVGNVATVYENMRFAPSGILMTDAEEDELTEFLRRHSGSIALR